MMSNNKTICLVLVLSCLGTSVLHAAEDADATKPRYETIVYTTLRPANWDVFLFEEGNEKTERLTDDPALDYNATFSPDGQWVVFTSERTGNPELFALHLSSRALRQLTHHEALDDAAAFSPTGQSIAFVSTRSGSPDVFVMDFAFEGGDSQPEPVNLTNSPGNDLNPVFSPDGARIAFSSNRETWKQLSNESGLYVMNADGSQPHKVSTWKRADSDPAWSADGDTLFFHGSAANSDPKPSRLYSVALGNNSTRELTSTWCSFGCTVRADGTVAWTEAVDAPDEFSGATFSIRTAAAADISQSKTRCDGFLRPRFDRSGKRMLCHGPGPTDGMAKMPNGNPFARPGADRIVRLPDRTVRVVGVRAYFPVLDSDGTVVAVPWVHARHGRLAGPAPIIKAALDGSNLQTILAPTDQDMLWATTLSSDGNWVYFAKGPPMAATHANVDIWRVRRDGSSATNLTSDSAKNDAFADVSADGSTVVFRSGRETGYQIFAMDADGQNVRRITEGGGRHTMPAISPDGKLVVYASQVGLFGSGGYRLFVKAVDQAGEPRLLEPQLKDVLRADLHPRFSPDGKWVVFTSSRGGLSDDWHNCGFYPQPYGDLWAAVLDGSHPAIRLTDDKWEDGLAHWSK